MSDSQKVDQGPNPYVFDIEKLTTSNTNFRTTEWTGEFLQMTTMSIPPGGEIGLEQHADHDQFLRVEAGTATVMMGDKKDALNFKETAEDDWAIFVPAGKWHNIVNNGDEDLKVYSLYGPPDHVKGTVHKTKQEADNDPNEQE